MANKKENKQDINLNLKVDQAFIDMLNVVALNSVAKGRRSTAVKMLVAEAYQKIISNGNMNYQEQLDIYNECHEAIVKYNAENNINFNQE